MERLNSEKILAEEVGILDNNSEWLGIPKSHLMECAGYSFALEVIQRFNLDENSKVMIFCGTGNNGGDGFVIARHLSSFGIKCTVRLVGTPDNIRTKESKLNWDIISNNLNHSIKIDIIRDSSEVKKIKINEDDYKKHDLFIDGLLGTGIKGKIRDPIREAITELNSIKYVSKKTIVSIDVPSGMDPDTGEVPDTAVEADLVITFHRTKKGMIVGTKYIKDIVVKSIGVPQEASLFVGRGDVLPTLKVRNPENHKGQFGRILVIGGSKNYSGAPAYSSLTGIHYGIDLVITYVPEIIGDVLRAYSPNLIVRTSPGKWLNTKALDEINYLIEWSNAVVIGPGLGLEKETEELLVKLLEKLNSQNKSYVLDADALKLVKNHLDLLKGQNVILTPHAGELKIMTDVDLPPNSDIEQCGKEILKLAKKLDVVLLVKGPYDYISNGKKLKIGKTGCAEMSIGGTGDVLAGLCACFLSTENDPFKSACSAAFLNGYIGEYCKVQIGPRFTAMDMISKINEAINTLKNRFNL